MKAIAEFFTVSGMTVARYLPSQDGRMISIAAGIALRIGVICITNLIAIPAYYGMPYTVGLNLLLILEVFNAIQRTLTVVVGYFLYESNVARESELNNVLNL